MSFRNLPIRRKLMLAMVLTSAVALLLSGGAMIFFELVRFRHSLVRELSTETEIIAANSAAAVAFHDRKAARETLAALQIHPDIVQASLFTADGKLFVDYKSDKIGVVFPVLKPEAPGHRLEENYVLLFRPVKLYGDVVGSIVLRSDLREETARLKASVSIAVVALLTALFVSLLLSMRFQKIISKPVLELANVAHEVMKRKDYSLRACKQTDDEIGQLIGAFNQMLAQIEKRDLDLGASEERFRQLAENIDEVFWITDPAKKEIIYISPAYETIWGRTCASIYQSPQSWSEAIHPEDRERVLCSAITRQQQGEYDETYRITQPDGSLRWIHDRAFPVRDAKGEIYRLAGIAEDITKRKRAEETLRRTEQLYQQAITGAGAVPYICDYKTKSYLLMGEGIERLTGYAPHELRPEFWKQIGQESVMMGELAGLTLEEAIRRVASGEVRTWRCDMQITTRDGQSRWISDVSVQNLDESGRLVGAMGILQDITERKQAEKKNAAFSSLASQLSAAATAEEAAASILETAAELIGWDCGFVRLYDRERDRIVPILTYDQVDGKRTTLPLLDYFRMTPVLRLVMEKGPLLIDQQNRAAFSLTFDPFGDKSRMSTSMLYVPIRQGSNVLGVLSIQRYTPDLYRKEDLDLLQSLTDHCGGALRRIQITEQLREAESKYRSIFEDATEGIFQTTVDGHYVNANPALARMFGYETPEEMMGSVTDIERQTYVLPEKRREWKRLLEGQKYVHGFEIERLRKDGSRFWVSVNVRAVRDEKNLVLYYEGTIRDITARRHLEKQLIEISDREQSRMGQDLHDGLCQHLVRTAFAANLLEKDLAAQSPSPMEQAKKVSRLVDESITQARNLARGLYPVKLEIEGLHSALQELAENIRSAYNLECDFESHESISITDHALATHLYRIAQEAAINAAKHAQPAQIQIRLHQIGDKIHLTVSDNGAGIPAANASANGMGLHIMNYRAGLIGAALKVEPQSDGGTIVTCIFGHGNGIEKAQQSTDDNH